VRKRTDRVRAIVERVRAEREAEDPRDRARAGFGRLWREYLRPHRRWLALMLVFAAVTAAVPFGFSLTSRFLVDRVLELGGTGPAAPLARRFRLAWWFVGMIAGLWTVNLICMWSQGRVAITLGQRIVFALRKRLHEKLQTLYMGYYAKTPTGRIVSRVLDDVHVIQASITGQLVSILSSVAQVVIGFGVLLYLQPKLTALVALSLPLYGYLFCRFRPGIRSHSEVSRHLNARLYGRVSERIAAVQVVKAFGMESRETRAVARMIAEMVRVGMRIVFLSQGLVLGATLTAALATGVVLYLAMRSVQAGELSLGSAVAFVAALSQLFSPVNTLVGASAHLQIMLVVVRRVFSLLDEREEVAPGKIRLEGMVGKISFRNVTFRYPNQKTPALSCVTFDIRPGERIAVMGPSGAGKSTVFDLLLRFHDPDEGQVFVGGVNLADSAPDSVRRHVCMVQQEPVIFSGTLADNIRYGRLSAAPREVMNAATSAELHEFILSLPLKYETEVGERGVTLSGGQKQRMALATALLTDPEVLLLDDTSSALDAETEAKIQETLNRALKGRTSLIITHRVATAREADRILVLEGGRLTQLGRHEELKEQPGFYRRICLQQEAI